jgi:hypothetical protein
MRAIPVESRGKRQRQRRDRRGNAACGEFAGESGHRSAGVVCGEYEGVRRRIFFFENNTILMENRKNICWLGEITTLAPC